MNNAAKIYSLWLFLALGACTKDPGFHVAEYKEIKFEDVASDVKVPSKIWDMLEFKAVSEHGEAQAASHGEAPKAEGGGEHGEKKEGAAGLPKEIIFSEVNVFLVEKNADIVKGEAIKIELPKGGGEIDLAQFISDQKGSFYVGFEFPEFTESTAQKVLFLSKGRKRRIDDKVIGAGCNQVLDITASFMKAMSKEGLKVNTTRERYTSVLAGTFFIAAQKAGNIYISQVTFKDSKHQNLFCEVP
ncbi:hypothetical protein [Bdellovibrio svalbardensis]|uniref:Lipoprotein n=1 Tax=Bdellovibrio svalbardensis TaxID=2972972 RepID=A0ABT6DFI4_9BACT|nr:hypothetical protein [Bdellovibrio svalbardensis]MDG0815609.1 hypothetical protein [Bdellovibrio svalbardensis]